MDSNFLSIYSKSKNVRNVTELSHETYSVMESYMKYKILKLRECRDLMNISAHWFHLKWKVPVEAYMESMKKCIENKSNVPQWYMTIDNEKIVGGLGVIENDFHDRKDLSPNVCAVYVEEEYRLQGIAGEMLHFACQDMKERGIDTLYLLTDHSSFYERYGWSFFCMVQGDGEKHMSRMYMHKEG